jgi:hypothetical protein
MMYLHEDECIRYGVSEAIVLSRLREVRQGSNGQDIVTLDGMVYFKSPMEGVAEGIKFYSDPTIKRALANRLKAGVIHRRADLNKFSIDRTAWTAIVGEP